MRMKCGIYDLTTIFSLFSRCYKLKPLCMLLSYMNTWNCIFWQIGGQKWLPLFDLKIQGSTAKHTGLESRRKLWKSKGASSNLRPFEGEGFTLFLPERVTVPPTASVAPSALVRVLYSGVVACRVNNDSSGHSKAWPFGRKGCRGVGRPKNFMGTNPEIQQITKNLQYQVKSEMWGKEKIPP